MTQMTFPAQVVNGQLHHEKCLADLEGQRVIATLTVQPNQRSNEKCAELPKVKHSMETEFDPEPPPWLDVENDVYFPMTRPERLLEKRPLIVERGTPCIILPEDFPDE